MWVPIGFEQSFRMMYGRTFYGTGYYIYHVIDPAVPQTQAFVQAAFAKGENAGSTTLKLLRMLDDYGAPALKAAVVEALERETPRISSVA